MRRSPGEDETPPTATGQPLLPPATLPTVDRWFLIFFGIPWLGHGRATEFMIWLAATLYAVLLFFIPNASEHSQATALLFWQGRGAYLFLPLAAISLFTGSGLVCNILGRGPSRVLRFSGAAIGFCTWIWFAIEFCRVDALATPGFVFCVVTSYASVRILVLAAAGLPRPGAPGNL